MIRYRLRTVGYAYTAWQGPFYPKGMGSAKWLGHYAGQFDSLELNTTFHAMPAVERVRRWTSQVGTDFRFTVKTCRAITHDQSLKSAIPQMLQFVTMVREMGAALGPPPIQLPPHCSIDSFADFDRMLGVLPSDVRRAVEFRHTSWVVNRTTEMLLRHNAAGVGLDHLDHPKLRRLRGTSDFLYVRLVGRHGQFKNLDHEQINVELQLQKWHAAIRGEVDRSHGRIGDVWVLANNDYAGFAPATLRRFASIAGISPASSPLQNELFA